MIITGFAASVILLEPHYNPLLPAVLPLFLAFGVRTPFFHSLLPACNFAKFLLVCAGPYTQHAYLFHQCGVSLLWDGRIADCTVRHLGVYCPFSSYLCYIWNMTIKYIFDKKLQNIIEPCTHALICLICD